MPATKKATPVLTGLACRCPRCGQGRLFRGFLTVTETCAVCGFDLRKADSGDGPAVFISFLMGALIVPLALWVEFVFAPPYWLHLLLWPPIVVGGSLALLRPIKGVMIALQFHYRAGESDHG